MAGIPLPASPDPGFPSRTWLSADYCWRQPDGREVIACVPYVEADAADSGAGKAGPLQIWRWDADDPGNAANMVEVEPSGVFGARLLVRKSGVLDLFYNEGGLRVWHRTSRTAGATWSERDLVFTSLLQFGTDLHVALHPKSSLIALVVRDYKEVEGFGSPQLRYLIRAGKQASSGTALTWSDPQDVRPFPLDPFVTAIQFTKEGRLQLHPHFARLDNLKGDGTSDFVNQPVSGGDAAGWAWIDESRGFALKFQHVYDGGAALPGASPTVLYWRWQVWTRITGGAFDGRWVPETKAAALGGSPPGPGFWQGYLPPGSGVVFPFHFPSFYFVPRLRKDGTLQILYADTNGDLVFRHARSIKSDSTITWQE